jgi:hypothetical protein
MHMFLVDSNRALVSLGQPTSLPCVLLKKSRKLFPWGVDQACCGSLLVTTDLSSIAFFAAFFFFLAAHFLQGQAGSTLSFGSEFRPVEQLRPLLRLHPGFEELAEVLVSGMPYRYSTEITEAARENEVLAMLERGNHKSAQDDPEILE